ncbi:uncharacterized protein LOC108916012 [Anoplophora glabripennis]|uniref:uncharacterized protein LOC108916012 n=1 Tax=Anoplophora glabripennis TaxID=217634 RepID=UPI00087556C6|nr:uncharacterized protein LOC108916012 [Anoplophora glabripennis]
MSLLTKDCYESRRYVSLEARINCALKSQLLEILTELLQFADEKIYPNILNVIKTLIKAADEACQILIEQDALNYLLMRLEPTWKERFPNKPPPKLPVLEEERVVYRLLSISKNKSATKWNPQQVCVLSHLALDCLMKIVPFMEEEFIENSGPTIFLDIICMYKTNDIDILILRKCLEALLHTLRNTVMVLDSIIFNDGFKLILGLCEDIVLNLFEDNFGKKCLTLAILILNILYEHSTQKYKKKLITITIEYMKKIVLPHKEVSVRDVREIICVMNFIWEHIVKDEECAKEFVKKGGTFLMLDMVQKFPFVVKIVTLGALVDLCQFDHCIPYLITWKRKGQKILPMLMKVFREENKRLKVKRGSHGQISDIRYPLMGKDQWFLTFCTCKPMTPGNACISDLFISCRPKIYALLQMLHMRHAEAVKIADEQYKSYDEELQPDDQVTRLIAENFLALKLGEAWVELKEQFDRSSISLTYIDNRLLSALTERTNKLAQYLQSIQNEIIQNANEKELFKEYKLYKHLSNGNLTDALDALSELKTIARSSEHMFRISEKYKQNKQIEDALKSHNIEVHRTFFATIRVTPVYNQTVNLTKTVSTEEIDLVPISPIESNIQCDIDITGDLLQSPKE